MSSFTTDTAVTDRTRDFVTLSGHDIKLSLHALRRYMERFSRFDDISHATSELIDLVKTVGSLGGVPSWLRKTPRTRSQTFVLIGRALAIPLVKEDSGWVATTFIALRPVDRGPAPAGAT